MAKVNFNKLVDYWDPELRKAFLSSVSNVKNQSQLNQIARQIENGDVEGAVKAVNLDPANFRILDKTFSSAFEAGGNAMASGMPKLTSPGGGLKVVFNFDIKNPITNNWLTNYTGNLVSDIVEDQRNMIRTVVGKMLRNGDNPRVAALELVGKINNQGVREGGYIGLTNSQESWVEGFTDDLRNNPGEVIPHYWTSPWGKEILVPGRKLRDHRYDKTIQGYLDRGEKIPEEVIDDMAASYRNRALLWRAEAIARTEAMAAMHEAQQQSIDQAVEKGLLDADKISFVWRTAHDKRVRESHQAMDGQEVAYGEAFVSGDGNELRYPGDPEAPASEIINCRCWREPKIDFLAGVT